MWGKKCHKILGSYCRHLIDKLVADEKGELALRLFLQCAQVVNQLPFEQNDVLAYEFFSQVRHAQNDTDTMLLIGINGHTNYNSSTHAISLNFKIVNLLKKRLVSFELSFSIFSKVEDNLTKKSKSSYLKWLVSRAVL